MPGDQGAINIIDDRDAEAMDAPGRWFVLHTRSRQEKALARDLRAMRAAVYLPMAHTVRYYGRRKARVVLPLFPNYLFLRGSLDQAYQADRTRRMVNIIKVADQAQLDSELRRIHQVLSAHGELQPHPKLQCGVWVRVTAGPFKNVIGQVERRGPTDRLVLQIQTLGQASSLEIDAGLLMAIESPEAMAA